MKENLSPKLKTDAGTYSTSLDFSDLIYGLRKEHSTKCGPLVTNHILFGSFLSYRAHGYKFLKIAAQ